MADLVKAKSKPSTKETGEKQIIGSTAFVEISDRYKKIPAKVDTGADSSSIWASNIKVDEEGNLTFCLFGPKSRFYDGHVFKFDKDDYSISIVRPSTGVASVRYRVHFWLGIEGRHLRANFTLADRKNNSLPILIGRRTLKNNFIVDVSLNPTNHKPVVSEKAKQLNEELRKDPVKFHEHFIKGEQK